MDTRLNPPPYSPSRSLGCLILLICIGITTEKSRADLLEKRNIDYARFGEHAVQLDWFRPDNHQIYPGILLIHGGGWVGGSRKGFEPLAKDLAAKGYVVANIDYRLATEAKFPGAVLDCKAAVRWMRANAKSLGLNPNQIAGVGGSAGGHLTAMVASSSGDPFFKDEVNHPRVSDALQAAIIMGAGVDQVARVKQSRSGSIKSCVIFFGGELNEVPDLYAKGSPITHISAATPPILMIDGELDHPGDRYPDFRKKLDTFGVKNEFLMIPGAKHGQWASEPFRNQYVAAMTRFLQSIFHTAR